ncbi:DUF3352 domain-containing protein [Nocardioides sp.]|uniref:DUF3352 domain-containing protein n=1 Tax=Nocardioides sp. TaxID=35761 RepID=UPI003565FA21
MSHHTPDESQEPELLELGGGAPMRSAREPRRVRRGVLAAAGVAALGLAGVSIWAAVAFFASGPQPAETLPASTVAYVSVDLDPSGEQKIAAVQMLRQFPAIRDEIGLDTTDDLRKAIFEEIQAEAGACTGLDYADDVEPWLGDRMALALVDRDTQDPAPVAAVQVTDAEAADAGLAALSACGEDAGSQPLGFAVSGGWAVLAESDEIAEQVIDDAAESSLADDADYRTWTEKAGGAGIVSFYVSDGIGPMIQEGLGSLGPADPRAEAYAGALEQYGAAAGALRFGDNSLELEMVTDVSGVEVDWADNDRGDDVAARLPVDTAMVLGAGLSDGWTDALLEQFAAGAGDGFDLDALLAEASRQSGLELPDDLETLTGRSVAISVGSDLDVDAMMRSATPQVPVAWSVEGDSDAVADVLDRVGSRFGPLAAGLLGSDADGDLSVIGPDPDYRAAVLAGGELGELEAYREAVPESERSMFVLFVNFDRGSWLNGLSADDPELMENLEPLHAFGFSGWMDGDVGHSLLRLTTD